MACPAGANVGCLLVGEFVDDAELPTNVPFMRSEVVRPHIVADFLDFWGKDAAAKEFTVLLKDRRIVVIHELP